MTTVLTLARTWLELPPAQGGWRFGPLPDEVRIGTGPDCEVRLAPEVGAPEVAVRLVRDPGGSWQLLLPSEPPHPCRVVRPDGTARRVRRQDRLRRGETLVVTGTDQSPELTLRQESPESLLPPVDEVVAPPPPPPLVEVEAPDALPSAEDVAPEPGEDAVGAAVMGGRYAAEAARRAEAQAMARNPALRAWSDMGRRLKTGQYASPVFLVGALLAALGVVGAAFYALWLAVAG